MLIAKIKRKLHLLAMGLEPMHKFRPPSFVTWKVDCQNYKKKNKHLFAGYGVRTHAHLCAEDLKSSPLTSRANQLI